MLRRRAAQVLAAATTITTGLVVAALTLSLAAWTSTSDELAPAAYAAHAAPPDAAGDYFPMPQRCAWHDRTDPQSPRGCRLTRFRKNRPTVVLWGDSHAWQLVPGLLPAVRAHRLNLVAFMVGGCPPLYAGRARRGADYPTPCHRNNALALRYARKLSHRRPPVQVLLASNWAGFRDVYRKLYVTRTVPVSTYAPFVRKMVRLSHRRTARLFPVLDRSGIRTAVVSQTATVPGSVADCPAGRLPYACDIPRRRAVLHEARTRRWLRKLAAPLPGHPWSVDVNGAYCDARVCHGRLDGIYTFFDDLHLSGTRARTLQPYFTPLLRRVRR